MLANALVGELRRAPTKTSGGAISKGGIFMGRPTEINLCSRIGCHVIYSRASRRSLTSPRGLLCVRKSRAIRNGHEEPPRVDPSSGPSSESRCSIEFVVSRARLCRDRPTMPRKQLPPGWRSKRSLSNVVRLNIALQSTL